MPPAIIQQLKILKLSELLIKIQKLPKQS